MPAPSCRLQLAGHQQLQHSVFTQLRWAPPADYETTDREGEPPEVWDDSGMFDPAHPEYVTIGQDGVFRCWFDPKFWDSDAAGVSRRTGRRAVAVQMNDGNRDILVSVPADPGGTTSLSAWIDLALRRGDRVSVWLEQQSGGTINATGHSAKDTTWGLAYDRPLAGVRDGGGTVATQLGLCINANGSVPDAAECAALGLGAGDWARTHVDGPLSLLDGMLAKIPADVSVMVTLNNQCAEVGWDWSGLENACQIIATKYAHRVKIVGIGNELDLWHLQPPVGSPDPKLTPAFAADLVRRASPILRAAGIKVALSSVASGSWPSYLSDMAHLCVGFADYADLHLYMKQVNGVPNDPNWQLASNALDVARGLSGLPVIASEAGIKIDDAGGLDRQAQWAAGLGSLPAELVCAWCWHDRMASPGETGGQAFGARGLDGKQKPLWFALQKLFKGTGGQPVPVPTPGDNFSVGQGMRDLMAERGDVPAADELYFHLGQKNEWSECMAVSGRLYRYVFSVDKTFSFPPEAA